MASILHQLATRIVNENPRLLHLEIMFLLVMMNREDAGGFKIKAITNTRRLLPVFAKPFWLPETSMDACRAGSMDGAGTGRGM